MTLKLAIFVSTRAHSRDLHFVPISCLTRRSKKSLCQIVGFDLERIIFVLVRSYEKLKQNMRRILKSGTKVAFFSICVNDVTVQKDQSNRPKQPEIRGQRLTYLRQ